jgi:hypothetical protein
MEDTRLRELVENELENLQLGVPIAKLRAEENLRQTKLAAMAEISGWRGRIALTRIGLGDTVGAHWSEPPGTSHFPRLPI